MQPGSCEIPERKTIFIPDAETETAGQDLTLLHAEERGRGRTSAAPLPWHDTATSVEQSGGHRGSHFQNSDSGADFL